MGMQMVCFSFVPGTAPLAISSHPCSAFLYVKIRMQTRPVFFSPTDPHNSIDTLNQTLHRCPPNHQCAAPAHKNGWRGIVEHQEPEAVQGIKAFLLNDALNPKQQPFSSHAPNKTYLVQDFSHRSCSCFSLSAPFPCSCCDVEVKLPSLEDC